LAVFGGEVSGGNQRISLSRLTGFPTTEPCESLAVVDRSGFDSGVAFQYR